MLSLLIFLPLAGGARRAAASRPRRPHRGHRVARCSRPRRWALDRLLIDFASAPDFDVSERHRRHNSSASSTSPTPIWISELGIHYKLALDGLNLFLILMTTLLWVAATAWSLLREGSGRASTT